MSSKIPIEVSARHIHISKKDLEALFGKGYELKKLRDLSQPGEFASKEKIIIRNGKRELSARIVGPCRRVTQVEVSKTDALYLGLNPPVRRSGKLLLTLGITLVNKKKVVKIKKGVIIAWRHIHATPEEAKKMKLKKYVSVKVGGDRGLVFNNVRVRIDKSYALSMHIDTDEGNAAGLNKKGIGIL